MKRHNEILVKHLEAEIHVALSGAQYKPLGKHMTDEDFDIARKTTEVLIDRTSIDQGLTLKGLATMILGDSSAQSVHKIELAIQWIKKTTLEFILEEGSSGPMLICKIDNVLFNCNQHSQREHVLKALEYHGLTIPALPSITTQRGGLIGVSNDDTDDTPLEPVSDGTKSDELFEKLKGNYTTKQGLDELQYLMEGIIEIIRPITDPKEGKSELELTYMLIPESRGKSGAALDFYTTKIRDALYVLSKTALGFEEAKQS
jgi:hypothetical protein